MIGVHDVTRDDNGTGNMHPDDPIAAGEDRTFTIRYVAGSQGIQTGGCLRLSIWRYWPKTQLDSPQAPGFTAVSCTKPGVVLRPTLMDPKAAAVSGNWCQLEGMPANARIMHKFHAVYAEVVEGELTAGDVVEITYRGVAPAVLGVRRPFRLATDPDGAREARYSGFSYIAESPEILVQPCKAERIEAFAPSHVEGDLSGESVRIVGRDRYANPCQPPDTPRVDVRGCRAHVTCGDLEAVSNYAAPADENGLRCYWGDLHVHTERSDGAGRLEDVYTYARDVMGLDFVGHGDHTQYMSDQDWDAIKALTRRMNDPGRFVSFPGFELSHNPGRFGADGEYKRVAPDYGDKNVYYLSEDDAPIMRVTDRYRSYFARFAEIAEQLRGRDVMIVPHLHAGGVTTFYDPELVWLLEAFSAHHCDKRRTDHKGFDGYEATVRQCLAAGWRVGLVGGSDNHNARAAQDTYFPWDKVNRKDALMAVWAKKLTREALWEAFRRRSVYATTGVRMLLDVRLNGAPMGAEIALDDCLTPKELAVEVHGTAPLARVEILRANEPLHEFRPDAWDFTGTFVDEEYSTAEAFYQVKVTQEDGNMAWSTPIWVDLNPAARVNFLGQEQTWAR